MEEKIIDGVNVVGCRRRIGKNSYCRYFKRPCADNNFNCIWKQKARLEQENERLKEEFTSFMNGDYCAESCKKMNNAFQDAHKGILKENEELKNILTNIDKKLELALDVEQTDAEESFDLLYTIQDLIREAIGE